MDGKRLKAVSSTALLLKLYARPCSRFLLRRITAVSSIHVTSWAVLEGVRKNSVSNFACFCLPLLLQPMAAEGVQLSLDLHQYFETGACMRAP